MRRIHFTTKLCWRMRLLESVLPALLIGFAVWQYSTLISICAVIAILVNYVTGYFTGSASAWREAEVHLARADKLLNDTLAVMAGEHTTIRALIEADVRKKGFRPEHNPIILSSAPAHTHDVNN